MYRQRDTWTSVTTDHVLNSNFDRWNEEIENEKNQKQKTRTFDVKWFYDQLLHEYRVCSVHTLLRPLMLLLLLVHVISTRFVVGVHSPNFTYYLFIHVVHAGFLKWSGRCISSCKSYCSSLMLIFRTWLLAWMDIRYVCVYTDCWSQFKVDVIIRTSRSR